ATSNAGESFYSPDGKAWTDFISKSQTYYDEDNEPAILIDHFSVCLKAFTRTAPVIFKQPVSQTVGETDPVTFSVTAVGDPIPTEYQWYSKEGAIPGATLSSYTINSVKASDAGDYYVVIKNTKGDATSAKATLTVLPLVSAPVISPKGGTYTTPWKVKISCDTSGVTIRYTTDKSVPTEKSKVIASGSFLTISTLDTTLSVKAWKTGWAPSHTTSSVFNITGTVATPTFDVKPGLWKDQIDVGISCTTKDPVNKTVIRYTTNGTEPTKDSDEYTTTKIHINTNSVTTIKAKAWIEGWDVSATATATYTITGTLPNPVLPGGGACKGGTIVKASFPDPNDPAVIGAVIRYTTSAPGKKIVTPTAKSPIITDAGVVVGNDMSITVMAFKTNWVNSQAVTANYTINQVADPVFSLSAGTYFTPQTLTISCPTAGATISYWTDKPGSPENPQQYKAGAKITLAKNTNTTIFAIAKMGSINPSNTISRTYTVTDTALAPVFKAKSYSGAQLIEIANNNKDLNKNTIGTIWYTLDGSEPDKSSRQYTSPFTIGPNEVSGPVTIKAKVIVDGWGFSATATAAYTPAVPAPEFSVPGGTYDSKQTVTIACFENKDDHEQGSFPGVTIRYTTNGATPTATSPIVPESGIVVDHTMTIKASAFRSNWITGSASATYTMNYVAEPVLSLSAGVYYTPQTLTISCATPGAAIYYQKLTGSTPDFDEDAAGEPVVYKAGTKISLAAGYTQIKAWAVINPKKTNEKTSEAVTFLYRVTGTVAAPTFSPGSTTLAVGASNDVTISCSTMGVNIYYTNDGSTPTIHSQPYHIDEGIHVEGAATIKAIAVKDGYVPSPVATAVYTGTLAAPVFTVTGESDIAKTQFDNERVVKITYPSSDETILDVTIRYTTDGKNPTASSLVVPDAGVTVNRTMTIKAQAFKTGWVGALASKSYTIGVATPTFSIAGGTIKAPTTFTISCATPGTEIYYATGGVEPERGVSGSSLYKAGAKITLNSSATYIAKAWVSKTGAASAFGKVVFKYTGTVATPTLSIGAGSYSEPQSVKIDCANTDADIYYTTNGTEPSVANGTKVVSGDSIPINATTTLKVKAFKDEWTPSATVTAVYTLFKVDQPTISPVQTTDSEGKIIPFNPGQLFTLNCGTPGATIRYTTNGNDPSLSDPAVVSGAKINIGVGDEITVKARAWKTGLNPSDIVTNTYTVDTLDEGMLNNRLASIDKFDLIAKYLHDKLYNYFFFGQFASGNFYTKDSGGDSDEGDSDSTSVEWNLTPDAEGWYTGTKGSLPCKMKSPNPGEIYLKTDFWALTAKKGADGLWDGTISVESDSEDSYEDSSRSNTVKYHVKYAVTFTDADLTQGTGKYQVTGTITVGKTVYPLTGNYVLTYNEVLSQYWATGSETFNKIAKTVDEAYLTGGADSTKINNCLDSVKKFILVQNYIDDKFANFLATKEFKPSGKSLDTTADTTGFIWSGPDAGGWYTTSISETESDGDIDNLTIKFKSVNANDIKLKFIKSVLIKDGPQINFSADLVAVRGSDKWSGVYNASYDSMFDNLVYHTDLVEQITDADLTTGEGTYDVRASFQVPGTIAACYSLATRYTVDGSGVFTTDPETDVLITCDNNQLPSDEINRRLGEVKTFNLILNCVWDKIDNFLDTDGMPQNSDFAPSGEPISIQSDPSFVWVPVSDGWYTAKKMDSNDEASVETVLSFKSSSSKEIILKATRTEKEYDDNLARTSNYVLSVTKGENGWNGSFTANGVDYTEIDDKDRKLTWSFSEPIADANLATGDGTYNGIKATLSVAYPGIPSIVLTADYKCVFVPDSETPKINITGSQTLKFQTQTPSSVDEDYPIVYDSGINDLLDSIQKVGLLENYLSDKFSNFLSSNGFNYDFGRNTSVMAHIPLSAGDWIPDESNSGHYKSTNIITSDVGGSSNEYTLNRTYWYDPDTQYHNFTIIVTKNGGDEVGRLTVKATLKSNNLLKGSFALSESGFAGNYYSNKNAYVTFNITSLSADFDNADLTMGTGDYSNVSATFAIPEYDENHYLTLSNYSVLWDSHYYWYTISGQETFDGVQQSVQSNDSNHFYF
ncbi:MAG TPA: hypothetical protein DDW65_04615, partial [Firmicutes bacterium]|nr:hypothetical protein [Bacillota bacterium]